MKYQVAVVGAGPVGLALAIDLGRRGVRTAILDRLHKASPLPKMERVNPRTMEHFRRLGVAARVRADGFPDHLPMDIFITKDLATPALVHHPQPPVSDLIARGARTNDGTMPAEPYQLISQYTLEPILREVVEELGTVDTLFGWEVTGFDDRDGGVHLRATDPEGQAVDIEADYLVGCDGGSSLVRKHLGIGLEGEPRLLDIHQALIYAPDLFQRIPIGKGRHYHFIDEHNSFLIVQDDTQNFTLHTVLEEDSQIGERFESLVGFPVDYVVRYVGAWTMRSMVAESYGRGHVFLAGDSAHLMNPTAGLGMNTGVGDAIDLGWKLNAVLSGWASPALLDSYERERRPVGLANVAYSRARFDARAVWRSAITPQTVNDSSGLARIAELADANEAKAGYMEGIELSYSYAGSPLFANTAAEPEDHVGSTGIERRYQPRADPGLRLPHVWIEPGDTAFQDVIPQGEYSLICVSEDDSGAARVRTLFAELGTPLGYVHIASAAARHVWGARLVLVRPDLHIVWRGDEPPADLEAIVLRSLARSGTARDRGAEL